MTDLIAMIVTALLFLGSMFLLIKSIAPRYRREQQERREREQARLKIPPCARG
jgi:hypothetical protein